MNGVCFGVDLRMDTILRVVVNIMAGRGVYDQLMIARICTLIVNKMLI
jgi:hypothetical protein